MINLKYTINCKLPLKKKAIVLNLDKPLYMRFTFRVSKDSTNSEQGYHNHQNPDFHHHHHHLSPDLTKEDLEKRLEGVSRSNWHQKESIRTLILQHEELYQHESKLFIRMRIINHTDEELVLGQI